MTDMVQYESGNWRGDYAAEIVEELFYRAVGRLLERTGRDSIAATKSLFDGIQNDAAAFAKDYPDDTKLLALIQDQIDFHRRTLMDAMSGLRLSRFNQKDWPSL